jgi:hypothetical protein
LRVERVKSANANNSRGTHPDGGDERGYSSVVPSGIRLLIQSARSDSRLVLPRGSALRFTAPCRSAA